MWVRGSNSTLAVFIITLISVGLGLVAGYFAGFQPLFLSLAVFAIGLLGIFFARFEQVVLGLLIVRTSLDPFSLQQIPSAYAIGLTLLTLLYVIVKLLSGKTVHTDKFWWLLFGWLLLQGLWVILVPLGGLGLGGTYLADSVREWIRLFTWVMVYLLVMQLKDKLPPDKVVSMLFWALVAPVTVALLQIFVPSILPPILAPLTITTGPSASEGARIAGTIGHPNGFVTMLLLFMMLTYWKLNESKQRLPWLLLLGLLAFCFVSAKALFGLMMLATIVIVLVAPRLNAVNLIGGIVLIALVLGLFATSDFGRERLASIASTPLLNPDMDITRAILLSQGDNNSFNWRLSQWYFLLFQAQQHPFLGFGLGLSIPVAGNGLLPHNDYIRALIEGGIVGLAIFLLFLLANVLRLVRIIRSTPISSKQRKLCFGMLALFLSMPVGMITENIWGHTTLFFYWMTLMAIVGWDWKYKQLDDGSGSLNPKVQVESHATSRF